MNRSRLTPGSKRRAARETGDRRYYVIIGVCVGVMALVGTALAVIHPAPIDPKTGCLVGHTAPPASTFVLVDETDSFSRDELAFAKTLIMTEYSWLPKGGRLTVRNIVGDPDQAEDIVVCRMDDGSNALGLVDNKRKIHQDFERIAGTRLDELFTALRTATPQKYSPILESISAVFDKASFSANIKQRRLVILSDMAQHSPLFSQYRHHAAAPKPDIASAYRKDMAGVAVRIQYIRRPTLAHIQTDAHRNFWIGYLKGMGADVALGHNVLLGEGPGREVWNDES